MNMSIKVLANDGNLLFVGRYKFRTTLQPHVWAGTLDKASGQDGNMLIYINDHKSVFVSKNILDNSIIEIEDDGDNEDD